MPAPNLTGVLRGAVANLLLALVSLAAVVLIVEMALRFFGMTNPVLYRPDQRFGYEPRPNQSSKRLGVPIYINDIALRDDEPSSSLLSSAPRILVIGDSVTYGGSRIAQADLFTEALERRLRKEQPGVKVLNAGVNGYSISQMVNRAASIVPTTNPQHLIIYAIRGDFFRPPVQFLREGNYIYPLEKPRVALVEFLVLSVNFIDRRYPIFRFVPDSVSDLWQMPENYVPEYDDAKILVTHFDELEEFLETVWEPSGRTRKQVTAFIAPNRKELERPSPEIHSDLLDHFKRLDITAHDLTDYFYREIVVSGRDVNDYYWDFVHYVEKGHELAANEMSRYLIPLFGSSE